MKAMRQPVKACCAGQLPISGLLCFAWGRRCFAGLALLHLLHKRLVLPPLESCASTVDLIHVQRGQHIGKDQAGGEEK